MSHFFLLKFSSFPSLISPMLKSLTSSSPLLNQMQPKIMKYISFFNPKALGGAVPFRNSQIIRMFQF